jgi:hypothetical protein
MPPNTLSHRAFASSEARSEREAPIPTPFPSGPFHIPAVPSESISEGPYYPAYVSAAEALQKTQNGKYKTGVVHVVEYPAFMGVFLDDSEEVIILGSMLDANRALHTNRVAIEILEVWQTRDKPTYTAGKKYGRVVCILDSLIPLLVGRCHPTINRFQPLDKRYPPLRADGSILTHTRDQSNPQTFYQVRINQPWNPSKFYPEASSPRSWSLVTKPATRSTSLLFPVSQRGTGGC